MSNSAVLMEQETKNSNKLINAYTRLDDFLNKFVGKTVMVTVDKYGSINSTRALYNFRWREEEDTYKNKHIIFYSFPTEEYISIPINGIRSYKGYFEEENKLDIRMKDSLLYSIFIDE